jgi:hypothetical protein
MKSKVFFIILGLTSNFILFSQNSLSKSDDMARITIAAYVPHQIEGIPEPAKDLLANKLDQIITQNGLGGVPNKERFIMTANVNVLTKDVTPTAPVMHAYTLQVTFYIGDGIEGTKFASQSITLKGTDTDQNKAYVMALRNIKTNDPKIKVFVEEGKRRIIEYYNSKCDFIIKEAHTLEGKQDYEQAIYKLTNVPQVCKDCYDKCQALVGPIYQKYIDLRCKEYLNEANNVWAINQDYSGAERASKILNKIDPSSSCYIDAITLSDKITNRIKEIDQREWNFMLKQQQDTVDIEKAMIKAASDIGVAYGENQPEVKYETVIYRWW